MVRAPRGSCLDALTEIVLDTAQYHGRVVDGVYMGPG
jgi:hypothetical protein